MLYETLTDIEVAISKKTLLIWHRAERVRSLIGEGWLLAKTNCSFKLHRLVLA